MSQPRPLPAAADPAAPLPAPQACAQALSNVVPSLMNQMRQFMRAAAPVGVSVPQMRMLIYARGHGGASLSDIAEHLGVTLPTVSVAAQRLIREGWIDARPHATDRRRSAVWLTPAGAAIVQGARRHTRQQFAALLSHADDATLDTIHAGLAALTATLETASRPSDDTPPPARLVAVTTQAPTAPSPSPRSAPTRPGLARAVPERS